MDFAAKRFADLQKQGFMKPRKTKRVKVERPMVSCTKCCDWHREGKHTRAIQKAFFKAGEAAFAAGKMCVPAMDVEVGRLLKLLPANPGKLTVECLKAWHRGWAAANVAVPVEI